MEQTVLYLVRTATPGALLASAPESAGRTVVLLEDGVTLRDVPAGQVYTLAEDAAARNLTPSSPTISFAELLALLFRSERVVTL